MKPFSLLLGAAACSLVLGACSKPVPVAVEDPLHNPLYAETYYKDLVQDMMTLEIQQDPALKDPAIKAALDSVRQRAIQGSQEATARRMQGKLGEFLSPRSSVQGKVLLSDSRVFFGPDFLGVPGGDVHVYLTATIDPRDATFPDETAVDLGSLKSPYDTQSYALPASADAGTFRTVVLWDKRLKRVSAFAQLRQQ